MGNIESIYIISGIAFLAVILGIEGVYLLWQSMDIPSVIRVNKRLREISASGVEQKEALSILSQRQFSQVPTLNKLFMSIPRLHIVDNFLEQAGMGLSVSRYMGAQAIISAILFLVFYFLLNWAVALALLVAVPVGIAMPYFFVAKRRNKRRALFSEQLPETLDFISRSLRAGNPLMITIKSVSEHMAEPSSSEFGITFNELNYGAELDVALQHLAERTGSDDVRFFITAVIIQRSTGGNLAEILNRISGIMRSRSATYREIGILAAEMKLSANILLGLPFLVAAAITLIDPGYLNVLFETETGLMLVGVQLALMGMGYLIVQKMISFKV